MAVCNSIADLQRAIVKELESAMNSASKEIEDVMRQETQGFYSSGSPVMYRRTGQLGRTPKVSPLESDGSSQVVFKAYLDPAGGYPSITYTYWDGGQTTSKAPSMTDVLNLTNYGTTSSSVGYLHPALGRSGYWERALGRMQGILDKNVGSHFK